MLTVHVLQIGFAVALVCEGILPRAGQQGFFGQDSPQTLWTLAGCAAAVICTAVVSLMQSGSCARPCHLSCAPSTQAHLGHCAQLSLTWSMAETEKA